MEWVLGFEVGFEGGREDSRIQILVGCPSEGKVGSDVFTKVLNY
jgi:hypothetical protein